MARLDRQFRGGLADLIRAAQAQGWTVVKRQKGVTLRSPDGEHTASVHTSQSDHRAIRNLRADLRRGGFKED